MHRLFKKILIARSVGALIGVMTSIFALWLLSDSQYAVASLMVSYSAVAASIFYMPFARFVLVEPRIDRVIEAFWSIQPLFVAILLLSAIFAARLGFGGGVSLYGAAAFFTVAQGFKFFCGEVARARNEFQLLEKLYVNDAATTLLVSLILIIVFRSAASYIVGSGVSSLFWCLRLFPESRGRRAWSHEYLKQVKAVYLYAYGPVAAGALNSGTLAVARTLILKASPPGLAGGVQFLLDFLQKPMSLLASSLSSAAIPEAAYRVPVADVLRSLNRIMWPILLLLGCLALLGATMAGKLNEMNMGAGPGIALLCAGLIWANRYKTSVMDLPLTASSNLSHFVLAGAAVSFGLIHVVGALPMTVEIRMAASAAVLLFGGVVSTLIAWGFRIFGMGSVMKCGVAPLCAVFVLLYLCVPH